MHFSLAFFWFTHSLHVYIYFETSFRPHLDLIKARSRHLESPEFLRALPL